MIATLAPRLASALDEIQIDLASGEARLTERLYAVLHAGLQSAEPAIKRDRWLEEALTEAVPHNATPVTVILRKIDDDELIVEWDGVLVRVPPVGTGQSSVGEPITLSMPPVRLALSPGFLLVTGSHEVDLSGPVLRVYVHLTDPHSAVDVWHSVLNRLAGTAYQAKVLSRASQYPRRDAIVVYLSQENADAARLVADAVDGMPGIGPDTSVFAEPLGPGVATAWEPTGHTGLSFGQHRCNVLARALLDAVSGGTPRELAVTKAFLEAGIDPGNPALNITRTGEP